MKKMRYNVYYQGGNKMIDLEQYKLNRKILCIDLKSFFASVECVLMGLDPFVTPLVVADKERGGGSIVLAVTPFLKEQGIPSRLRIHELPNDSDIIFAKPQMQKYIEYSTKVINTYLNFVSEEDLYVYSIDEAFLDVTNYLDYYKLSVEELAEKILKAVITDTGLYATCGIGPNMLIAKLAMDIDAKHADNFIAKWDYKDISTKLWPVTPLSKMWGIGHRMEAKLNVLGMHTIGDIAKSSPKVLKNRYGVLGEELWYHTNGIDLSMIQDKDVIRSAPKSFGVGQALFKDYYAKELETIILEMTDDVTRRLRLNRKMAKTISLSVIYSKEYGGGFNRQTTLEQATHHESIIYQTLMMLFDLYYEGLPVRKVGISLSGLTDSKVYQYSLFEDADQLEREYAIHSTLDVIKSKYGKNAVIRLSSEEEHATAKKRNKQIGGHHV